MNGGMDGEGWSGPMGIVAVVELSSTPYMVISGAQEDPHGST